MLAGLNLTAGSHSYVIHATDSAGTPVATQYSGTFDLAATVSSGPTISNVVITEFQGNGDGVVQAGEKVEITWSLTDPDGIFSTNALIDNLPAKVTYGPYGANFAAVFDPFTAGSHSLAIRATDNSAAHSQSQYNALFSAAVAQVLAQTVTEPVGSAKTNWLFT